MSSQIVTTQKTGKFWKLIQTIGFFGIVAAVFYGMSSDKSDAVAIAFLSCVLSLGVYIFGRVGGWWFHG